MTHCWCGLTINVHARCGLTIHATPGIREEKPQKSTNKNAMCLWRQFENISLPVVHVARMPPQARKGICLVAGQSFGLYIRIHHRVLIGSTFPCQNCIAWWRSSDRNVAEEKGLLSQMKTVEQIACARKFYNIYHRVSSYVCQKIRKKEEDEQNWNFHVWFSRPC